MKQAKQMGWILLGVVVGFVLGAYALLRLIQRYNSIPDNPTLTLCVAVPLLGGGLVGGGYLAQWLVYKYERRQRRKQRAEKQQAKVGGKKKK